MIVVLWAVLGFFGATGLIMLLAVSYFELDARRAHAEEAKRLRAGEAKTGAGPAFLRQELPPAGFLMTEQKKRALPDLESGMFPLGEGLFPSRKWMPRTLEADTRRIQQEMEDVYLDYVSGEVREKKGERRS